MRSFINTFPVLFAVPVDGNVTDELLEEFYGQEISVDNTERPPVSNLNPGVQKKSGETTHARKEITPGRIYRYFSTYRCC